MISKFFSIAAIIVSLSTVTAFAAPAASYVVNDKIPITSESKQPEKKDWKQEHEKFKEEFKKDPLKALENRKTKIQSLLREGKITKEKADEITAKIDAKIKKIQEFNKLTPQQKKDALINRFKARIDKKVTEGKIDKAKAESLIKDFTDKVNKWDGNGYPRFHLKHR